eukprot:scaffold578_cov167-Amphora_coffeaeformis.AAC.6
MRQIRMISYKLYGEAPAACCGAVWWFSPIPYTYSSLEDSALGKLVEVASGLYMAPKAPHDLEKPQTLEGYAVSMDQGLTKDDVGDNQFIKWRKLQ